VGEEPDDAQEAGEHDGDVLPGVGVLYVPQVHDDGHRIYDSREYRSAILRVVHDIRAEPMQMLKSEVRLIPEKQRII
jgi:hypothetical protein